MTDAQQRAAAKAFAKNWKDRGYEKGDSQIFWVELLTTVFGVTEISQFISFEDQVHLDHASFIDGYIEKTHVMIEQKSINKSLTAAIRKYFVENPEAFDPRAYLKAARAASVEMCKSRYIAFGCEGQASKIKPLPLSEMARLYSEGVLRQKVNG